jgi:hypothetical protein
MIFIKSQGILHLIGLLMISSTFSRRIATRFLARAFTNTNGIATRHLGTNGNQFASQFRFLSSARDVAQVDVEDLDAALDNLLGDAFEEAEVREEAHIKDSHPIPKNLVEEVSGCCYPKRLVPFCKNWLEFLSSIACFLTACAICIEQLSG